MPHWLIKSAIQRGISVLPARQRWNGVFQKLGTKTLDLSEGMFELRMDNCRTHIEHYFENRPGAPDDFTAYELGTGWFPTIAIGMFLCGSGKIWAVEIDPLLAVSRMTRLVELFCQYAADGRLATFLPRLKDDRLRSFLSIAQHVTQDTPEEFLSRMNIVSMVRDSQHTGLPDGVADFVFSYGVFEFVPKPVLGNMLREFRRISTPGAVMSHYVIMADQFAVFDRAITKFNYLRYPAWQWRWLDSPLMTQNRLRASDYRRMMEGARFRVVEEVTTNGDPADLDRYPLASEFADYSRDDLLKISTWLVSVRR